MNGEPENQRTTRDIWLDAALDVLTSSGVEAVKIMPLAKSLGMTRTGFYGHFQSREEMLDAMIARWEQKNTGNLESRCTAYADTICEAIFNLFDCWIDNTLFDSPLDLAIRNWARNDPALQLRLEKADTRRAHAIESIFRRFGYVPAQASARAMTVVLAQIGYISMRIKEDPLSRIMRMPAYVEVYSGKKPTPTEIARFSARHGITPLPQVSSV